MTEEPLYINDQFKAFIKITADGVAYINRMEHRDITGYSFPNVYENRELVDLAFRMDSRLTSYNFTKNHLNYMGIKL